MRYLVIIAACALACGTDGPAGEDGADGLDGADGADNHITDSIYCTGLLESTTINFTYHAALLSSGDLFVSGSIRTVGQEVGASTYYSAGQNGALTAPVIFTGDVSGNANSGWWQIALNRTTLVTSITYNDVDVSGSQDVWTMPSSSCVVYSTP